MTSFSGMLKSVIIKGPLATRLYITTSDPTIVSRNNIFQPMSSVTRVALILNCYALYILANKSGIKSRKNLPKNLQSTRYNSRLLTVTKVFAVNKATNYFSDPFRKF